MFVFVFVILKGKIINLWSLFIHDFLVGLFVFQFHSLIFSADPQIFIIFQQFLYMGILFFDFFDFLYLSILLLVLKKKNYVCPDSSLESVKHIFKNNKSEQTNFFFFKLLGHSMKASGKFFFFFGLGHDLGPNRGMAGRAHGYPTGRVWG